MTSRGRVAVRATLFGIAAAGFTYAGSGRLDAAALAFGLALPISALALLARRELRALRRAVG